MKVQSCVLMIIASANMYSQDFRGLEWGMSQESVQKIESLQPVKRLEANSNNFILIYDDRILGDPIKVVYQFLYNSLECIKYDFQPSSVFSEPYTYMNRYLESLIKKYGPPLETNWNSSDPDAKRYVEMAQDKDTELSMMIFDGTIQTITSRWETKSTNILLSVYGSKTKIDGRNVNTPRLSIIYCSKRYDLLVERTQNEYINEKL